MAKGKIKGASVLFVCWTGLMAVVCVPSFIVGISCTESGEPISLLNASVTQLESDFISLPNAAAPDQAEQPIRQQTAEALDTSFDTHREALELSVQYTDVRISSE